MHAELGEHTECELDTGQSLTRLSKYFRFRKDLTYRGTNDIVTRVVRYTVVSGMLTSSSAGQIRPL